MIPSPPINQHYQIYSCRFTPRHSQARIHALNSQTAALANTPHSPQRVHSRQFARTDCTDCTAKSSLPASLLQLATIARVPKSP
jgi:hypothetical protein